MLALDNLTNVIRLLMVEEVDRDINAGTLYFSERFNQNGHAEYAGLIHEAAERQSDGWLETEINERRLLKSHEQRRTKNGYTMVKVPHTAAQTFAEGEFNRFYLRALCRFTLENGGTELEVYRAKSVTNPRMDSEARIGTRVSVTQLLDDLRANNSVENALRLPPGPNSGLSARLIVAQ